MGKSKTFVKGGRTVTTSLPSEQVQLSVTGWKVQGEKRSTPKPAPAPVVESKPAESKSDK